MLSFQLGKKEIGRTFYRDAVKIHNSSNLDIHIFIVDDVFTYIYWSKSEELFGDRQKSDEYKYKAMEYLDKIGWKGSFPANEDIYVNHEQKPSGGSSRASDPGAVLPQRP